MSETVLFIDELISYSETSICRICHEEEEFESCQSLETPCACSGTLKFAHRDCVQRWCYEKGNTTCEICLQKFEPGYTPPHKETHQTETTVSVSGGSLRDDELEQSVEREDECASEADCQSASRCRLVALILTVVLLTRHLFALVIGEETYPLSIHTVIIAKAIGIIIPMYILIRILEAVHKSIRHYNQISDTELRDEA